MSTIRRTTFDADFQTRKEIKRKTSKLFFTANFVNHSLFPAQSVKFMILKYSHQA